MVCVPLGDGVVCVPLGDGVIALLETTREMKK